MQKSTNVYKDATQKDEQGKRRHSVPASRADAEPTRSSHRCCAERLLLNDWIQQARKRGLRNHQIIAWVRRKVGPDIMVWRYHKDGQLACAMPCLLCSRVLQQFDMRVHASQDGQTWFSGKLAGEDVPETRPTAGQIRTIIRPQRDNQQRKQRVATRPVPKPHMPAWL